jgi:protein-S-isoprenylcysteine O-methyltransferase Ste14
VTPEFWAIIGVGVMIYYINMVAADENEKRLNRIIGLLGEIRDKDYDDPDDL